MANDAEGLELAGCRDSPSSSKAEVGRRGARREGQLSGRIAKVSNRPEAAARGLAPVRSTAIVESAVHRDVPVDTIHVLKEFSHTLIWDSGRFMSWATESIVTALATGGCQRDSSSTTADRLLPSTRTHRFGIDGDRILLDRPLIPLVGTTRSGAARRLANAQPQHAFLLRSDRKNLRLTGRPRLFGDVALGWIGAVVSIVRPVRDEQANESRDGHEHEQAPGGRPRPDTTEMRGMVGGA